jgi:hypothetical protein
MIKGIMGGNGVIVNGGNTSLPYVNMNNTYGNNGNPMQGMLRINGTDIQVFDGNTWINLSSSYATVELNGDTQSILQWAREQRDKQYKRQQLIKNNPALQKAMEAIQRAEANFDLLEKFVENDNDNSEQVQSSP